MTETEQTSTPPRRGATRVFMQVGTLILLGCLGGLVWWATTPRFQATFVNGFWYNPDNTGYWVRQDLGYAVIAAALGIGTVVWFLVTGMRHDDVGRRFGVTLAGSVLGALGLWGVGLALGWHAHPAQGKMGTAALQLHGLTLLGVWPAIVCLVTALVLLWLTWMSPADPQSPDDGPQAGPAQIPEVESYWPQAQGDTAESVDNADTGAPGGGPGPRIAP